MTKDTEALQRRSAEPSDGEIYSLASFGGDANAKARFVAGLIEKVEQAPATPASDVAPVGDETESIGLRIAERIRQELTSGRQWSLGHMDSHAREEFEAEIASTCVAVCEQELAHPPLAQSVDPAGGEVDFNLPPHMDPAFVEAWCKMEDEGYQYSESNVAKVHLGWMMAHKFAAIRNLKGQTS